MGNLSELPDHLIVHIISLANLTSKEAIQISVLSKELFWAVQNRAALIFNPSPILIPSRGRRTKAFYREEELEYVYSTLVRYHNDHIPLDSFTFKMGDYHRLKSLQNHCFTLAAQKRPRHLNLRGYGDFPEPFSRVESLVNFSLRDYSFGPRKQAIAWPNLKRLCLDHFTMKLDDFENIIMGSPLIENLEIINCFHWSVKHFKVSNLRSLKQLNVHLCNDQTFEVKDVPELESITCHCCRDIQTLCQQFNGLCQNLRTLSLNSVRCSDIFPINSGQFPRLENLSISNSNSALQIIVISSLSLKNIRLQNISSLDQARFDVPNVVLFEYISNNNAPTMSDLIPDLSFSGNPAGWISRIKLSYMRASIETRWFLKLNEFLTALSMSEISITVKFHAQPLHEYYLKNGALQNVLEIRPRVREFDIDSSRGFSIFTAGAVVDAILWVCRPQTVTFPPRYPPCYLEKLERLLREKRILQSVDGQTGVTISLREGCLNEVIMNEQKNLDSLQ